MDEVSNRLRLLSGLHYALAVLTVFNFCGVIAFGGLNTLGFLNAFDQFSQFDAPPISPFEVIWPVLVLLGTYAVCLGSLTIPIAITGFFLGRRIQLGFCRFVAILELVYLPFGLILGLVSLNWLSKPEYKTLFSDNNPSLDT